MKHHTTAVYNRDDEKAAKAAKKAKKETNSEGSERFSRGGEHQRRSNTRGVDTSSGEDARRRKTFLLVHRFIQLDGVWAP